MSCGQVSCGLHPPTIDPTTLSATPLLISTCSTGSFPLTDMWDHGWLQVFDIWGGDEEGAGMKGVAYLSFWLKVSIFTLAKMKGISLISVPFEDSSNPFSDSSPVDTYTALSAMPQMFQIIVCTCSFQCKAWISFKSQTFCRVQPKELSCSNVVLKNLTVDYRSVAKDGCQWAPHL